MHKPFELHFKFRLHRVYLHKNMFCSPQLKLGCRVWKSWNNEFRSVYCCFFFFFGCAWAFRFTDRKMSFPIKSLNAAPFLPSCVLDFVFSAFWDMTFGIQSANPPWFCVLFAVLLSPSLTVTFCGSNTMLFCLLHQARTGQWRNAELIKTKLSCVIYDACDE